MKWAEATSNDNSIDQPCTSVLSLWATYCSTYFTVYTGFLQYGPVRFVWVWGLGFGVTPTFPNSTSTLSQNTFRSDSQIRMMIDLPDLGPIAGVIFCYRWPDQLNFLLMNLKFEFLYSGEWRSWTRHIHRYSIHRYFDIKRLTSLQIWPIVANIAADSPAIKCNLSISCSSLN